MERSPRGEVKEERRPLYIIPNLPLSLRALRSWFPRVRAYETLREVMPNPYKFWGSWAMTFGVLSGILQICLDSLMRHLSSVLIWGIEKGAAWKEYVI